MTKQIFVKKKVEGEFGISPEEKTTETLLKYGIINIDKLFRGYVWLPTSSSCSTKTSFSILKSSQFFLVNSSDSNIKEVSVPLNTGPLMSLPIYDNPELSIINICFFSM